MADSTTLFVNGRRVGSVAKGAFCKTIHGSKHLLRYPRPAIALDLECLRRAEGLGALAVIVKDVETGVIYSATIGHILQAGTEIDRGYGRQIALDLEGWTKSKRGGEIPRQLSLFV